MKKIFLSVFLLFTVLVVFRFYRNTDDPYPYVIEKVSWEGLEKAGEADILIIGDRMGEKLAPYLLPLLEKTTGKFKKNLKMYNWSRSYEGLHRTLAKLRSLSRWPTLLIYHGASEEFYENKIHLQQENKILKNFQYRENESLSSLGLAFPWIFRIVYHPVTRKKLAEKIIPDESILTSMEKQKQMEVAFKIFQHEMKDLIDLGLKNKSRFILITTPLNLELPAKKICHHSITKTIQKEQRQITDLLKEEANHKALQRAQALAKKSIGNAHSFHLVFQAAKALKKNKTARDYGNVATSFDCQTWRGNAVFNSIVQKAALTHQISLLDFNYFVNRSFEEQSFADDFFPTEIHYQKFSEKIIETALNILGT